jgi:hypothetical protein
MKIIICLTLACASLGAETLKWSYSVPIPLDVTGVYTDGKGGAVVGLGPVTDHQTPTTRIVWLDTSGKIIFTNDFKLQNGTAIVNRFTGTDLYVTATDNGGATNYMVRYHRIEDRVTETSTALIWEDYIVPSPVPDPRGFLTQTAIYSNAVWVTTIVRRYSN